MAISVPAMTRTTVWNVDPKHTQVEFAVRHLGISTIKGRFKGVRGEIRDVADDRTQASVEIEIDPASVDSGEDERDGHVRSPMFFDVETYPAVTFRSTRIDVQDGNRLRVVGDLSLHGVVREVALDATVNGRAIHPITQLEVLGLSAATRLSRQDFGIELPVPFAGSSFVSDDVDIWINVEATRARDSA